MSDGGSKPVGFVFIRDNRRRYNVWEGDIDGKHINIRGYSALFPEGYLPGRTPEASLLKSHAGAILHDNMDGSFSVLPRDSDSANDANLQPYVVSQGGMPSPSPSLLHPSHSMPPNLESGAIDTSAMPVNDDKPKPLTGNKSPTGKMSVAEVNMDYFHSHRILAYH
ncbi:hypothetical protein B0T09DRAFT_379919 [Sordaria sp. MPI-SDFR-AT-0083]|nr:hypothetical protein B0T09DRAFT_379919 [Sordaria sp. MPI-SDFR-AT-0083]